MLHTDQSITINAPPDEVFAHWRRMEDFSTFMEGVEEVKEMGDRKFLLRTKGPSGPVEFLCELLLEVPARRLAWRSLSGPDHAGIVAFEIEEGGHTRLRVKVSYDEATGWGDEATVNARSLENLQRFKERLEAAGIGSPG